MTSAEPQPTVPTWPTVQAELDHVMSHIDADSFVELMELFNDQRRTWYFTGQGRSGLVARMAAMRFMHLGFTTHVIGDVTAPSIQADDGLLVLSSSGSTPASVAFAEEARKRSALVGLLTSTTGSPLAQTSDVAVVLPTFETHQFAGSLFEQSCLLLLDSLTLELTTADGSSFEKMASRHTTFQ
ncbi:SIS domain-containing protein [Arthrobacter sp. MDB2-24]